MSAKDEATQRHARNVRKTKKAKPFLLMLKSKFVGSSISTRPKLSYWNSIIEAMLTVPCSFPLL